MKWICNVCGYVYDGKSFIEEKDDYVCPLCDAEKVEFDERDINIEIGMATNEFNTVNK